MLSGVFPAAGVTIGIVQHRRVDALGVLVLAGIAVGAVLGLVSHNARLVLDEGSVPTAVFGVICLGSLATPKPLMYRLAVEFIGPDSAEGPGVHRPVAVRRSSGACSGSSPRCGASATWPRRWPGWSSCRTPRPGPRWPSARCMPYAVAAVLIAWTVGYGRYQKRKGEQLAAAAEARRPAAAAGDRPGPAS